MSKPFADQPPTPDFNDEFSYWTFKDMHARRIVASRTDLHRKQHLFGFPKPVILTGGRGANALYKVGDVKLWLIERERLATQNTPPEMKAGSRPRGRPRKNSDTLYARLLARQTKG